MSERECKQYFRDNFGRNQEYISPTKPANSNDPRDHLCEDDDQCYIHVLHLFENGEYFQAFWIQKYSDWDGSASGKCHKGQYRVTGCNEIEFTTCSGTTYRGRWRVYERPQDDDWLLVTAPFRVDGQSLSYTAILQPTTQTDEAQSGLYCFSDPSCS